MSRRGKGKGEVRRRSRAPSLTGRVDDGAGTPPTDDDAPLSRAERRRRKLAPSDRARDLAPHQKRLLGLDEPAAPAAVPVTLPPPVPRPPRAFVRHDLLVPLVALALLAGGAVVHRRLAAPALEPFSARGLSFDRPSGWLPPVLVPEPPLRLAADAPLDAPVAPDAPYHVVMISPLDPRVSIEVRVQRRGDYEHPRIALALARATRYGEAYWAAEGTNRTIAGRDWLRTRFRYAAALDRGAPHLAIGIEYAAVLGERLYLVTFHGDDEAAHELEDLLAPGLAIAAPAGSP